MRRVTGIGGIYLKSREPQAAVALPRRPSLHAGLQAGVNGLRGLLIVVFLVSPAVSRAQTRLLPVDQAASVPDFFSFRAQLQVAVARRDVQAVVSALSRDVKLSFGGDEGVDAFHRLWKPAAPDSRLWEALAAVLALGGTFSTDGSFTAPYVFATWPRDKDAFTHMAAIGTNIRVRSAPSTSAEVIEALDYAIVESVDGQAGDAQWAQIRLSPKQTGFVDGRFLRSPIDYRINFARRDGRWQIVFFVAGD